MEVKNYTKWSMRIRRRVPGEKAYWKDLWECYIEEKSMDYASLSVKEAIPRLVSEQNLRERRHACRKLW